MIISVIIPIYNSRSTIIKTIRSIVNQKNDNFELILVDDGSSDDSLKICKDEFKNLYNIKYYRIQNSGVSNARNFGIANSTGDYIVFVDSDDYVDESFFETLDLYLTKYKTDLVFYNPVVETRETRVLSVPIKNIPSDVVLHKDDINNQIIPWVIGRTTNDLISQKISQGVLYRDCYNAPWQTAYKRKLIKDICFNTNLTIYEDLLFNLEVFFKAKDAIYCCKQLYHYVVSESGLASKYHENYIEQKQLLYSEIISLIEKDGKNELIDDLLFRVHDELISVFLNETKSDKSYIEKIKRIKKYCKNNIVEESLAIKNDGNFLHNIFFILLKIKFYGLAYSAISLRKKLGR